MRKIVQIEQNDAHLRSAVFCTSHKNQITIIVLFFIVNISTFVNFLKKLWPIPSTVPGYLKAFFSCIYFTKRQIIFIKKHDFQSQSENLAISSWYRCKHTYFVHSILPKQPCRYANIPCTNPASKTIYHGIKGILLASSKYEKYLLVINQLGA